ncbi:MAG TPA: winged helix DNA-binding domain-containing protein [Gaiellaceae bacterium]|nr:winged helix DNA-binding domain-containing protein [Gaiellaceae bacterium]
MARRIPVVERRARLARRHRLADEARARSAAEVAGSLVGLHGTDPASVYIAAAVRMRVATIDAIAAELYEARSLVRMLAMRRTMWVFPVELAAIAQAAATDAVARNERRKLEKMLVDAGVAAEAGAWLELAEAETLRTLASRGEATGAELSSDVPQLREQFRFGMGTKWEGVQTATTRLLLLLAAEGKIVRARPRGSWISSQYRWMPLESWLPGGFAAWDIEAAQTELVRRCLYGFGPATVEDVKWWTGWTLGATRRALSAAEAVEVDLDGAAGLVLPDDVEPVEAVEPWAALLPALDPTAMGWLVRSWYLGEHGPALFDRSGNVGPTVWWDGRIVGGWGQRPDGEVVYRLLEDVGAEAAAAIEDAAGRVATFVEGTRVTPRFRTPLERELSA